VSSAKGPMHHTWGINSGLQHFWTAFVRELLNLCGAECVSADAATASRLCPAATMSGIRFILCLMCQQHSVLSLRLYSRRRRSGCLEAEGKGHEYGLFGALDEASFVSLIAALLLSYLVSASAVAFRVPCPSAFALRRVVPVSWMVLFSECCHRSTDGHTLRKAVLRYVRV
jgi:hypothetical protein